MVSTDMQCIVNDIGRIVIPVQLRKKFDITEDSIVEIYLKDGSIYMKKIEPTCILCNASGELHTFKGKPICQKCLKNLDR